MRTKTELQRDILVERWIDIALTHSAPWRVIKHQNENGETIRVFQLGIVSGGVVTYVDIESTRDLWRELGY